MKEWKFFVNMGKIVQGIIYTGVEFGLPEYIMIRIGLSIMGVGINIEGEFSIGGSGINMIGALE